MKASRFARVLCVAILASAALTGCQISTKKSPGTSPEVEVNGADVTVTGKGGALPAGFPSDVPLVDDAKITTSNGVSSGGTTLYSVKYETAYDAPAMVQWYKTNLPPKGWVITSEGPTPNGTALSAQKNASQLQVRATRAEGASVTKVTLSVNK